MAYHDVSTSNISHHFSSCIVVVLHVVLLVVQISVVMVFQIVKARIL